MAIKDKLRFVVVFVFLVAKSALEKHQSPVIIDNTNTQGWEMKPYVSMVREFIQEDMIDHRSYAHNLNSLK